MKKLVSLVLVLVLMSVMVLPTHAEEKTRLIFDGEPSINNVMIANSACMIVGAVDENSTVSMHPAPTQGEYSYALFTDTGNTVLYYNLFSDESVTNTDVAQTVDITQWDYIELDLYSNQDVCFDFQFAVTDDFRDAGGTSYLLKDAVLLKGEWTHVRIPVSNLIDSPTVDKTKICRIKIEFTNIADIVYWEPPYNQWLYIDNVVATRGGAGFSNELEKFDNFICGITYNSSKQSQAVTSTDVEPETYMLFDGETEERCYVHTIGWGYAVGLVNDKMCKVNHPPAYEGQRSLCVAHFTGGVRFSWHPHEKNVDPMWLYINLNDWNQLEWYLYSHEDITFDLNFGANRNYTNGISFSKKGVSVSGGQWTRIVMPIDEFTGTWNGTGEITRLDVVLTKIVRTNDSENTDPIWLYFDNFLASGYDPILSYGDIDGENDVTASDALMVLQSSVDKLNLSQEQLWRADVDGVEGITSSDALAVLMCSVGKIDKLPVVTLID